jgi:hypothetical protein
MRGCGIKVEIAFFAVLAVISLIAGQSEEAFFEDGIAPVPQSQREADTLMTITDSRDSVFVPSVRL